MSANQPNRLGAVAVSIGLACVCSTAAQEERPRLQAAAETVARVAEPTIHASDWLSQARDTLMNAASVSATIRQKGQLSGKLFTSSGTYVAGQFPLVRLEMRTKMGGLDGVLIEVCDGQVLWTVREIHGLPRSTDESRSRKGEPLDPDGIERRIARRDIDMISDALVQSARTPEHVLAAELGVGGLPTLLAGLQWAFDYRTDASRDGGMVFVGRWKPSVRDELKLSAGDARVPTEIEIHILPGSPVPKQIAYFRHTSSGERQGLLVLAFEDVRLGKAVDVSQFRYAPPAGSDVVNRTPDVIARIKDVDERRR